MADKVQIEQPQETPEDPGYSNEDLKKPLKEIAAEQPLEPVVETPASEPIVEPDPSLEDVGSDIAKKTALEVLEQQEQKRQAELDAQEANKEPDPKEKAYLDWEKQFTGDKGRQPSYLEALQFVEEQARANLKAEQEQVVKDEQERQQQAQAAQEAEAKEINRIVDDEIAELYEKGKLTSIKDPNNPSDQGAVERQALFAKWAEVNADRRTKGLPEIISATRIYENYYTKPNAQPPGENAPIAGNSGSATAATEEEYSYADIKRPWSMFKKRG